MPAGRFALRGSAGAPAAVSADSHLRLAAGVTFERASADAGWIAMVQGVPSARVSPVVIDVLTAMDGETAVRELRQRFAPAESPEGFLSLVQRFSDSGLIEGAEKPQPGRIAYRPPFTLQFATLRAPAIFAGLDRLTGPLSRRPMLVPVVVLLLLGLMAAAVQATGLWDVVTAPVSLGGLGVLVVALALITALHESAHGLTLTRLGGTPRRAGFMLFYLSPAFFVDVTDGWRLPDRRHRVAIALAGPTVHAVAGSIALITALAIPQQQIRQTLLLLGVACIVVVLVNLIPFVRFDGYIALMSALDEPNLRDRTMRDGARFLARIIFGAHSGLREVDRWWSVPFGLASLVTPVILIVFAVSRIARALAGGGPVLGLVVVGLELAVVLVGVVLLTKALRRVFRSGVSRLRFALVLAALASTIGLAGCAITVPTVDTVGFITHGDRVVLVRAGDAAAAEIPAGADVGLVRSGILWSAQVGEGTATRLTPEATTVPLDALIPVTAPGVSVPAMIFAEVEVSTGAGRLPPTGQAHIERGVQNLWQTLWMTGVVLPLSSLQIDREEEG